MRSEGCWGRAGRRTRRAGGRGGRMLKQEAREKKRRARTTRRARFLALHEEEDPSARVRVRQMGRQATGRGAQAEGRARRSLACEAPQAAEALSGARDDEAVPGAGHAASEGRERADPFRHRRWAARGLPRRRVLPPGRPYPCARGGERRALALARDERPRDEDRAWTESSLAPRGAGLPRALPRAPAHDPAGGAQRTDLRVAERAQARCVARVRAGRVLVGSVLRRVELPGPEGCQSEARAPRASADLAAVGRLEEARAHRSARGASRRGGVAALRSGVIDMARTACAGMLPRAPASVARPNAGTAVRSPSRLTSPLSPPGRLVSVVRPSPKASPEGASEQRAGRPTARAFSLARKREPSLLSTGQSAARLPLESPGRLSFLSARATPSSRSRTRGRRRSDGARARCPRRAGARRLRPTRGD